MNKPEAVAVIVARLDVLDKHVCSAREALFVLQAENPDAAALAAAMALAETIEEGRSGLQTEWYWAGRIPLVPKLGDSQLEREFHWIWKAYPKRLGNPRLGGLRVYKMTRKRGATYDTLLQAAKNYADYRAAQKDNDPKFTMQMSRFYGPDEPWQEYAPGTWQGYTSPAERGVWKDPRRLG